MVKKVVKNKFIRFRFLSIYKIRTEIISDQVTGKYIKSEIDRNCNLNHNACIKCDELIDNQNLTLHSK